MEDIKTENEGNSSVKMEDIKTENEGNSSAKMEDIKTENEGNSSAESIIISESDNDSDYEPAPKKKAVTRKAAKPATKKPAKKKVEKPPKVKKTPVKRKRTATKTTKTASKKAKIETNLENETLPENSAFVDSESCFSGQNDTHSSDTFDQLVPSGTAKIVDTAKIVENAKKFHTPWKDEVVIAEVTDIPIDVAKNIISLFEQECTIPFIVRYRKEKTGGLQAEKLRDIQAAYDEVKLVHKKVENILKTVKSEKFDEAAATSLLSAKTLEEVEFLYAPFKPGSKRTLAERSKQLGLEPLAQQLLEAKITLPAINFSNYIKPQKGLKDVTEIKTGIQYIIADVISKDRRVLDFVRSMSNHRQIRIISSKAPSAEKKDKQAFVAGETTDNFKYENYFNLNIPVKFVAHHQEVNVIQMVAVGTIFGDLSTVQVMAVNRGEKKKVLTVKIEIPFDMQRKIKDFIWHNFFGRRYFPEPETPQFLQSCVKDSYERLIEPHLCRQIRSDLTKKAEKESIAVFCSNVRSLLLTPPVRGKTVIGVDPGFSHGCKIAVLSSKGDVLKTDVIYPFRKKNDFDATKLKEMISSYGVEIIAIGNGTACRETEKWLSNLITLKFFSPFEIKYCIVNESGVSIYSVTKEAEAELPNMDANLRSAAAIGRRLQDPLLEYVKIEPKHLGVGMYQHDIPEAQLKKALDGVVEECVSFVGVDLNVCPEFLLKKISGLNATKAKHIVEWRNQHGSFINRQQLLDIKGLGPKSFEQCAGFVKILPETSTGAVKAESGTKGKKNAKYRPNPLDRTIVHPESYEVAERFLKELSADPGDVGMQMLVDKVNNYMKFRSTGDVAKSFNVPVPVMQLIIDAFKQLLDYDIRAEFDQPLFKTSVRKLTDLKAGQELSGRVMNVTSFGAFVDIGVEKDGLIHVSKMFGQTLSVGERVTVKVLEVQIQKSRITLQLLNKQPK